MGSRSSHCFMGSTVLRSDSVMDMTEDDITEDDLTGHGVTGDDMKRIKFN